MKTAKKLFASLLAVVMALALAVPAWAAVNDGDTTTATGSITIIPKDNGEHTFTAYQIFKGELSASGVLSNVEWGSAFTNSDGSALVSALKSGETSESEASSKYFTNCTTAATVAEALDKMISEKGEEAAASALTAALQSVTFAENSGTKLTKNDAGNYAATNLDVGYYLVKDSVAEGTTGAKASDMILQVVGNVTINAKADIPEVKKEADGDSYGIGDEITYTLTATVPDYNSDENNRGENYTYNLQFTDTMSSALDLVYTHQANESQPTGGITVKMGETDVTGSFTIRYDTTNHVLTATCDDISKIDGVSADSVFTVTYKAKINSTYTEGAVDNKVTLITKDYESTDITEKVFPIKLQVLKVDGATLDENGNVADNTKKLQGAQFTLQNEESKYLQVGADGKVNGWVDAAHASTLTTDEKGTINVVGLAAGTYTLTETVAPDGYNLASAPFTLTITAAVNQTGDALETLNISVDNGTALNGDTATNTVTAIIENNQGAQLPSTGGIGTTIFYVIGGVLVVAAIVLLVTRKRMNNAD